MFTLVIRKALLLVLAAQPAVPGAVQLATSAVPAHLEPNDFRLIRDGLHLGGKGLLVDISKAPYQLTDLGRKWDEYQAALARDLRKGKSGNGQLKVLVVTAVSDTQREALLWEDNVRRLAATSSDQADVFHWALFHHDNTTEEWADRLIAHRAAIVFNHVGPGCKLQNWGLLPQNLTEQYDYIWLMDSDLRLDFFRWDLYRAVLTTLNPLVSQPSILPPYGGGQSTAIKFLKFHGACFEGFTVATELPRSEVQAPLLSTKIWPAVRTRIRNGLLLGGWATEWFTDSYWDVIAQKAKDDSSCGQVGPLLVNAAPVWHQSWKTLTVRGGGKCQQWRGAEINWREVSSDEEEEVKAALLSIGCRLTTGPRYFGNLFQEQAHEGNMLCKPSESKCRKWIDGGTKDFLLYSDAYQCYLTSLPSDVAELAKRGMVNHNDTEHMLGGLQVGVFEGYP